MGNIRAFFATLFTAATLVFGGCDQLPEVGDVLNPPSSGWESDDHTDDTPSWGVTDETDTEETEFPVDTDRVVTDTDDTAIPPVVPAVTFPSVLMTELVHDQLCPPGQPCLPGWNEDDDPGGRPVQRHPGACTVGGWTGPADASTVCVLDARWRGSTTRGIIRTLNPDGTWSVPPDGVGDWVTAGFISPDDWNKEANYIYLLDVNGDGQVEVLTSTPEGLLFTRQADGSWVEDQSFRVAWETTGLRRPIPGIWDLDDNGLPDMVLMSIDGLPWTFFQQRDGSWEASQNFTRLPGTVSDLYTWVTMPGPDGSLRIIAMGAPGGGNPTGVFEKSGTGPDGYPVFVESSDAGSWGQLPYTRPMGGLVAQLDADEWPELVVTTSSNDLCFSVYDHHSPTGEWFDETANVSKLADWSLAGGTGLGPACIYWPDVTRPIPWETGNVDQSTFLTAWGDDGRRYIGTCPGAAECPDQEPVTAHLIRPGAGSGGYGEILAYPPGAAIFQNLDGSDATLGNYRGVLCGDLDSDGDADCVVTGVYQQGTPKVLRNDTAGGARFCARLRGNGITTNHLGSLSKVTISAGGAVVLDHQVVGYRGGFDTQICVTLGYPIADVEIDWSDGTQSFETWTASIDDPNPVFVQP